jgi:error-prone DNA polymerase
LTIYDIVDFAQRRQILCQGRGSAANSVVCYCLGVTAIDPVRMKLLFERFISAERGEPPDIDVDFEHERREEIIQYIYEKYGRHRAAMVSAVVTYQKRSCFRELSKAFGIPVGTLSAKRLMKDFAAVEQSSPLPDVRGQIDAMAEEMATFPRHLSIHSGGFTLSADPITEIVPVEPARMPGRTIIQWDKYDLDILGLLKVDVLALGMLSALRKTLDQVGMRLHAIPAEDRATYAMIQKGDTAGTFQVESRAQMNMSGRLQPQTFYDLVVQVAIVRPGPVVGRMVHPYLRRRRGLETVAYPHPKLREILSRTLGVPLFQEQLMRIAIELGGFSPGEADQLRRAIGAWRASGSIQKVAERLLRGLRASGVPEDYSLHILEHLKGFAHYGFPESHAASFALLTYASCYLKCHYPAQFLCGLLNSQPMGFYATHTLVDDAKRHGVVVLPVDPQRSDWDCTLEGAAVRLGLRVVGGLSRAEAERIVRHRPYATLADFVHRARLRSDVLHRMALGDAFAGFGEDERHTLWSLLGMRALERDGQLDLFAGRSVGTVEFGADASPLASEGAGFLAPPSAFEAIREDYAAFGLSVREHPIAALRKEVALPSMTTRTARRQKPRARVTLAGLVIVRQQPPTAKGVCFSAVEDEHGFLDMVLFKDVLERYRDIFLFSDFLEITGRIERDGHSVSLIAETIRPLISAGSGAVQGVER